MRMPRLLLTWGRHPMRCRNYTFLILLGLLLSPALSQAQTATATATSTATGTPVAVPSPVPVRSMTTNFGYIGPDPANGGLIGGRIVRLKATAALTIGQFVVPDTANDNQVVFAPSAATNVIGVVVGAGVPGAAGQITGYSVNPGAGQIALIQINGIAQAVCDGTIARGTKMQVSASIVGGMTTYSAGTVDQEVGVLLSSCTNLNPGYILLYK
jgi:hypothetical protein